METVNSNDIRSGIVHSARRGLRFRWKIAGLAVALVAINAGVSALMVEWRTPDVVTFDMKGTIDRFMDQSSRKSLDEATSRALTERFTSNLNRSIEDWQASHHALILVTPAVVSGASDITVDIQKSVAQRMAVRE
jgi:conjugal transfer pilin signal peptidase TrbI